MVEELLVLLLGKGLLPGRHLVTLEEPWGKSNEKGEEGAGGRRGREQAYLSSGCE